MSNSVEVPFPPSQLLLAVRTYFGRLSSAIGYLHGRRIRHNDIKPANILIKSGSILIDFGLPRYSIDGDGNTISEVAPLSPRYCAPEVAAFSIHNESSDIWSLGCVFSEMVAALKGWKMHEYRGFSRNHGTKGPYIRDNFYAAGQLIAVLGSTGLQNDNLSLE